jgi:hypothetical protein
MSIAVDLKTKEITDQPVEIEASAAFWVNKKLILVSKA